MQFVLDKMEILSCLCLCNAMRYSLEPSFFYFSFHMGSCGCTAVRLITSVFKVARLMFCFLEKKKFPPYFFSFKFT